MTREELLDYLKTAVNLESLLLQQKISLNLVENKLNELSNDVKIQPPKREEFKRYRPYRTESVFSMTTSTFWKAAAGIFGLISIASGQQQMESVLILFILLFMALLGIMLLIDMLRGIYTFLRNNRAERQKKKTFDAEAEYEQNRYQLALQKHSEFISVKENVQGELTRSKDQLLYNIDQLSSHLNALYERNIIYPRYRNLIAVTQIFEYMESGVAEQLEGPNGAYAQYLLDERNNRICTRLEDITQQLIEVNRNLRAYSGVQYMLYMRLGEIYSSLQGLNTKLGVMNQNIVTLNERMVSAETYLKEIQHMMRSAIDTVDVVAVNSYVNTLNQYRQATIDKCMLLYPVHV